MTNNLPDKTMIQIGQSDWQPCRIYHNGLAQNHYIKFVADGQTVTLHGNNKELAAVLSSLLLLVDPATDDSNRHSVDNSLNVTPNEVIEYFRNSPVLAGMADDVEAVLSPLADLGEQSDLAIVRSKIDVNQLLTNGQPVRGAQAEIARALEIPNAGNYRKRVLAVLSQIINSTTLEKPQNGVEAA